MIWKLLKSRAVVAAAVACLWGGCGTADPPAVRSVETESVPTSGGILSGGGSWRLPVDEVFTVVLRGRGNPGYDFVRWTEDGAMLSDDSAYSMQVVGTHRISGHFSVNRNRGKWGPANTYSDYQFPDTGYESLAWTFLPIVDPPESLREEDLLHYYAYQFHLLSSTSDVGIGYAGFQSDGHLETDEGDRWGKVVNYSIWGSDSARTDGLPNPDNEEYECHQIMARHEWVEGREYRFELSEGPGGEENEDQPTRVRGWTNSGTVAVGGNGHRTTLCHVTVFQNGSGNVQHNVGYWPEPPENVLESDNRPVRR